MIVVNIDDGFKASLSCEFFGIKSEISAEKVSLFFSPGSIPDEEEVSIIGDIYCLTKYIGNVIRVATIKDVPISGCPEKFDDCQEVSEWFQVFCENICRKKGQPSAIKIAEQENIVPPDCPW